MSERPGINLEELRRRRTFLVWSQPVNLKLGIQALEEMALDWIDCADQVKRADYRDGDVFAFYNDPENRVTLIRKTGKSVWNMKIVNMEQGFKILWERSTGKLIALDPETVRSFLQIPPNLSFDSHFPILPEMTDPGTVEERGISD